MELHFEEIHNLENNTCHDANNSCMNPMEVEEPKYWNENREKKIKTKKKVTFDDILTTMNLVVNTNGVLQYMLPTPPSNHENDPYNNSQHYLPNHNNGNIPQEPLDSSVKHSYIYNKYFKDYKDQHNPTLPTPRVPKTIQEYNQMIIEDKLKRIKEINRINQIKSTKMFFFNNIQSTKNNLRKMKF
jgi:hypothetical protein